MLIFVCWDTSFRLLGDTSHRLDSYHKRSALSYELAAAVDIFFAGDLFNIVVSREIGLVIPHRLETSSWLRKRIAADPWLPVIGPELSLFIKDSFAFIPQRSLNPIRSDDRVRR